VAFFSVFGHTQEKSSLSHLQLVFISLFGRPYRIVDYLLLVGLVREKNTVSGWKFTIVYEQANRLIFLKVLGFMIAAGAHNMKIFHFIFLVSFFMSWSFLVRPLY